MPLRKIEVGKRRFYWRCENPDCPYESGEIEHTRGNYHATPPECPRCGGRPATLLASDDPTLADDDGLCQGIDGTSAGGAKCNQPAAQILNNGLATVRVCQRHAELMKNTGGNHTLTPYIRA